MLKMISLGDVHLPYHDADSVKLALKVMDVVQPDIGNQVGDMLDGYHLSRFDKDPDRKATLAVEAKYGRALIRSMRARCGRIAINEGNHEERLRRVLMRVPELHSTHPSMRELLELEKSEWFPYEEYFTVGKCNVVHDLGPSGIHAIRQTLDAAGHNIIFGHTHTLGSLYDGTVGGSRHVAMNVGWLGNPAHANYAKPRVRARWQWGLGYTEIDERSGECWMFPVPFVNGACNIPGYGRISL